jgi:hypothetical protein
MGIKRFMPIISPKASSTYHHLPQSPRDLCAIPDSGARNPATRRRLGFVWLWRLRPLCHSSQSYFSKSYISRMIGVMRTIVEHSARSNV